MKEMLAVFDRDEAYVKRLSYALQRNADCPFSVEMISDGEDLARLSQEGKVAVLLLGEGAEERNFDCSLADRTVRLTPARDDREVSGESRVYKYQPVQGLVKVLMAETEAPKEERTIAMRAVPDQGLIGVASPIGRCGKTAFSLTLARLLSEEKSVLSFDLEAFSGLGGSYGKTFRYGLSDLLYAERVGLSAWKADVAFKDFIGKQWRLDMAAYTDGPEVIIDTVPGEIVRAAERLLASGPYECAVLDLGTDFRLIREFLPKLGKLYVPTLPDAQSQTKTEAFLGWVRKNSMKQELPVETLLLPEGPAVLQGEDPVEALLFGEMGSFIRKLVAGEA